MYDDAFLTGLLQVVQDQAYEVWDNNDGIGAVERALQ